MARDAILLAEANVPPDESMYYFGDEGDRLQMMLNFPVNQRLYYAFATHDPLPLKRAIRATLANIPPDAQWVQFLRSHDELDPGRRAPGRPAGHGAQQGRRPRHSRDRARRLWLSLVPGGDRR